MDAFHTLRADEWWHVFHRKQWMQNSLWNWSTGRGWCANKNPSCRSHPLRCQTTYYKSVNNNQFVNREKLYLDHSSWMWNEYHPVPVCHIWKRRWAPGKYKDTIWISPLYPDKIHLFSILLREGTWVGQHCIAAAQFKTLPHRTNVNRDDGRWDIARNLQAI